MRVRKDLEINVLEASKIRIRKLFSMFDSVSVSFSGGKDSLVLLELVDEVRLELGIDKKLVVIFMDEEVIQSDIVDFVKSVMGSGRFEFRWLCAPLNSERFLLGKKKHYIQWDNTRQWVRPMPEWAEDLTNEDVYDETTLFDKVIRKDYGSIVSCVGVRAEESNTRRNAIMRAKDLDDVSLIIDPQKGTGNSRAIFDWTQQDIFKYIMDKGLDYCKVYDRQVWGKAPYRVATPFNNAAAKHLDKIKNYDPEFYNQLLAVFPDTEIQTRYYKLYDKTKVYEQYGVTPEGIIKWANETLEGTDKVKCLKTLDNLFRNRQRDYAVIKSITDAGGLEKAKESGKYESSDLWIYERNLCRFPLAWIFYRCVIGSYKKAIDICTDGDINQYIIEKERAYEDHKSKNEYNFE